MLKYISIVLIIIGGKALAQNSILWSIEHPEIDHKSYLLGTFHQIGNGWVDSLPVIIDALVNADLAIFESVQTGQEIQASMNTREGSYEYRSALPKKDVQWLEAYTKDWLVPLEKVLPAELHWKLSQQMMPELCNTVRPSDHFDHLDNYLLSIRDSLGMPTYGFETDSMQADLIFGDDAAKDWKIYKKEISRAVKLLRTGKPEPGQCALATKYMTLQLDPFPFEEACADDVVVKVRNASWMTELPALLHAQSCFVAVGLLHLLFDCGLIVALKELGFIVEPIYELRN